MTVADPDEMRRFGEAGRRLASSKVGYHSLQESAQRAQPGLELRMESMIDSGLRPGRS